MKDKEKTKDKLIEEFNILRQRAAESVKSETERKQAEDTLRESEEILRAFMELAPESFSIYDSDLNLIDINKAGLSWFPVGTKKEDLIGKNMLEIAPYIKETGRYDEYKKVIKTGKKFFIDEIVSHPRFGAKRLDLRAFKVGEGFGIIATDITERKNAEKKIKHLSLVLRAIRNVNQLITRERDQDKFLQGVCDNLTETRGYHKAWIALLDDNKKLVTAAESGLGKDFSKISSKLKRGELPYCGQSAMKRSEIKVIDNPSKSCKDCPLGKENKNRGAMAIRLEYSGKVYGFMSISILRDFATDKEEQSLFKEVANDIAFALHNMELEEERKQAEEALRESKSKYRALFDNMLEGFAYCKIIVDKNNKPVDFEYIEVNDAFETLTGIKKDQVTGKRVTEAIPGIKKAHPELFKIYGKVALTGEPTNFEIYFEPLKIWLSTSVYCPKRGYFVAVFDNITKRKQAEQALRASEEQLGMSVETMLDGFAILSAIRNKAGRIVDFRYEYINESGCQMNKRTYEEQVGHTLLELLPAHKDTGLLDEYAHVVERGKPLIKESVNFEDVYGGGQLLLRAFDVRAVKLGDGLAVTWRDVTERKKSEEELKETLKDLERSNKELEQFAYVASHDLQEPLRMVASYVQLLERRYKDKLDSDANEFIAYAADGAGRMQSMINDLLDYSRVGSMRKTFEKTDCAHVLKQVITNLCGAIEESGAVVTNDDLPIIKADESQLIQLFQNLLDNSIKFRGKKPPRVHIAVEKKGKEWLFSVQDNGVGIDPQYAERIFVIFQRLHNRRKYSGTGIGLAICKRITERHGGRIWVKSKPGKGSTFFFTIPRKGGK